MLDQQLHYQLLLPIGVGIGTTERTKFAKAGISTFAVATGNITKWCIITTVTMNNVGFGYTNNKST